MNKLTQCRFRALEAELSQYASTADHVANAIYRGLELTDRLSKQYKMEDKVPVEVRDYIVEFEDFNKNYFSDGIQIDISCESALELVTNVVKELWRLLCKLYDMVKHCVKLLLSAQYRAAQQAIKYRQKINLMKSSVSAIKAFEAYESRTMPRAEDFKLICQSTSNMITLLLSVGEMKSAFAIDTTLRNQAPMCGFTFENNHLVDSSEDIEVFTAGYSKLGWTADKCDDMAKLLIDCTGSAVKLKKLQNNIDTDVSEIQRKMNNKVAAGASSDDLSDLHNKLMCKTKAFSVIKDGIEVIAQRMVFLDRVLGRVASDAGAIANGKDPGEVGEDFGW